MNHTFGNFWQFSAASAAIVLGGAAQAYADCPNADTIPTAENLDEIRAALVCLHNEERRNANVPALALRCPSPTAAQGHADDMVASLYFAHDTPTGVDPFDRMRRAGYIGRGFVVERQRDDRLGIRLARDPAQRDRPPGSTRRASA